MGPEAILLSVRDNGKEGSYRFQCPSCADDVEKRADRKIVALLVSAGVDIERGDAAVLSGQMLFDEETQAQPTYPEQAPDGPALTADDLIEFLSVASGLVRRLKVLGRTLRRFSDDVQPLTEAIAREGARASERGSTLGERSRSSPR